MSTRHVAWRTPGPLLMSLRYAGFSFAIGWALLAPVRAAAGSMDPALERLVEDPACRSELGAIDPSAGPCVPDQAAFVRLVSQYGFAVAPTGMHPARTTGIGGFQISIEGVASTINSSSDDWKQGTRGSGGVRNDDPAPALQVYSLRLRKGLGWGIELGGQFGFMPQTSFITVGGDVRFAPLEGFREGVMGRIPDVSVGAGVRSTTGSAQLQVTVFSADVRLSKPFVIRNEGVITPWFGFQQLWIVGRSGFVDLTPATNAHGFCRPSDASGESGDQCDGSSLDYQNNVQFESVHLNRPRLLLGTNYQWELLSLSAQVMIDAVAPANAQSSGFDRAALASEPRQWGVALDAGVRF